MSLTSEKQIFLITGATNGIGLDSALKLASASPRHHVIIGARNLSKGEAVLKDIQAKTLPGTGTGTVSLVHLDANDDSSIAAAAKKIEQDFSRLDVLINNAGICPETMDAPWPSRDTLRCTFETNVFGPAVLTAALLPLLKESTAPKVINVSSALASIAGCSDHSGPHHRSGAKYPAYRMSKAALNMLTAYQYHELKPLGFKIWTYCPGYVVTDLGGDRAQRQDRGVESSETSAQGILEIVEGKRDAEVGTFIARYGQQYQW